MPKTLLPVPHRRQGEAADCLAACAAMVLDYLNTPLLYDQLLSVLEVKPFGVPRRNILALNQYGVKVVYREASLEFISEYLAAALPVIAFVYTGELAYWQGKAPTNHAVVVVGLGDEGLLLNDPEFEQAPQVASVDEFLLAWQESDNACAVISLP